MLVRPKNVLGTVAVVLVLSLGAACGGEESTPVPRDPVELSLTIDGTVTEERQVVLGGSTNLPDGAVLATSVSGGTFVGQDGAVVRGGRWSSGPFGPATGLAPGTYEASVTLPYGRRQPEAIQQELGEQLERLTGPLMTTNPDLAFMGQSATVKSTVTVR